MKEISFSCFACLETFVVQVDFAEINTMDKKCPVEFDVACQCCGLKGMITIMMADSWCCEYCRRIFQPKKETENYEETCEYNK